MQKLLCVTYLTKNPLSERLLSYFPELRHAIFILHQVFFYIINFKYGRLGVMSFWTVSTLSCNNIIDASWSIDIQISLCYLLTLSISTSAWIFISHDMSDKFLGLIQLLFLCWEIEKVKRWTEAWQNYSYRQFYSTIPIIDLCINCV